MKKTDIDPSLCNNVVLRQAARRMGQIYDEVIAPSGLRATQYGLLAQIAQLGEPTLTRLAEALVMDLSALGHTLKPLVRDGLIEMVQDGQDKRAKRTRLTPLGVSKLNEAALLWKNAQGSFERAFGVARAADLRTTLSYVASEEFLRIFLQKRAEAGPG